MNNGVRRLFLPLLLALSLIGLPWQAVFALAATPVAAPCGSVSQAVAKLDSGCAKKTACDHHSDCKHGCANCALCAVSLVPHIVTASDAALSHPYLAAKAAPLVGIALPLHRRPPRVR